MDNSQLPGQGFCSFSIYTELPVTLPGLTKSASIQLKALFLLLVFSVNTVIGLACSMNLNMGINAHHPERATTAKVHVHADGKKHIHQPSSGKHNYNKSHHTDKADHHKTDSDANCCNEKVTKFEQLDKSVTPKISLASPVFFTAFVSTYYSPNLSYTLKVSRGTKYFVRSHHPPIPDIRIAIHSFQI